MSALGSLVVKLALEYAQFSQGLQANEQEVKQHAKRVQDTYEQMAAGVADRMDRLKGAVLGAIGGAVSAYGLSTAIAKIKQETIDAEKEQQQLAAAIKSTGGAAGWSVEKLNDMAASLEKNSNYSAGQFNQAQARMLSYSGVVGEVMPRAMQAVADMSERMGYQVTAAAETIGKALDVPSAGLSALSEQGFRFTAEQKELVKQFERTGQTAKAQGIILDALESSYGGAAKAARDTLGGSMQAVSHSINSLMTADSASLPGLRDSVEGLVDTLNSDSVRAGFQAFIGAVADVGSFAANSMAQLVRLGQAAAEHKGEIAVVLGMLAGAGTAAGALQVAAAIGGAGGIVGMLGKARAAVIALSLALAANPATLVLLGIGAATGAAIASNMGDPVGDKLTKEIEYQTERLAQAEALLDRAGGPKGQMTAKLEARIDGIRAHLDVLRTAAGVAKPAVAEVAAEVAGVSSAASDSGKPLAQSEEWLRKYGTAAQKAGVEIDEWKRKLGAAFTPEMEKQIRDLYAKQDEGAKAGAQSAKQLQTAYDGLAKSLAEKITEQKQELQSGEKLTESDKLRIKFSEDLKGSLKGLSTAQRANVQAQLDSLAALEKESEARKVAVRLAEEERKYRQEWWTDQARTTDELAAGNVALREEIELIGLTSGAQAIVLRQRQEAVLLSMEQRLEEMKRAEDAHGFMSRERIALEQNIALMRERLALTSDKGAREASAAASAASAAEWQKGVEQIGQSLTDQLMAGGQSFGDYLKNLGRTLVFRPLIQAVVQTSLGGVLGSSGSSGGSGSDSSLLSILSGAKGLMGTNTAGGLAGSFSAGMAGGWAGFEGGISMMQNGSMLSGGAQALGAAAPYIGGLFQMANGKYGSGVGTMAGAYIGSIVPGIGTAIGAVVGSLLGSLLDGEARGANHSGAAASSLGTGNTAAAQKLMQDSRGDWYTDLTERYNEGLETKLSGTVNALAGVYEQLSGYAGSAARQIELVGGFAANGKYGDEGAVGYGQLWDRVSGQYLGGFSNRDLGTDTEKAWLSYVGQMGGLIVAELKASDIPGWMRDQLNAIGDDVTVDGLSEALQAISAIDLAFKGWADTLTGFAGLSAEAQTALINVSGGIEGLAGNVNTFYEAFYTEAERMATLQRQVLAQLEGLGVSVDTSTADAAKASFKAAVEGALDAGNGELAAKLLALSGSFATAADYAGASAEKIVTAAQESAVAAAELATSLRSSLIELGGRLPGAGAEVQQLRAEDLAGQVQGLFAGIGIEKDAGALAQQILAATSGDVEQYFREMWSLLDTDEARQQLVQVTGALLDLASTSEAAAQAVASERLGLEQKLLQSLGATGELRRRELEALDPSNRALQQLIYGIEDLQTAAEDAAQKADAAWQGWGTAASLSASHLGDVSGLQARQAILNAQISSATDPAQHLAKLQELIGIEQAIGQVQQANSKSELDALGVRQQAVRAEISAAQQLLSVSKSLGDYVKGLQIGEASGLSDADRLGALGREYSSLLAGARGGDASAMQRLQGVAGEYLSLSKVMAESGADYSVLAGLVAAELGAVAKGQELVASAQVAGYEAELVQLTQHSALLAEGVELSEGTKSLIAKSMLDQADAWDRENSQAMTLAELQQRATDSLATMPDGIARAINPVVSSAASYVASSVGSSVTSAINTLAGLLGTSGGAVPGFADGGLHAGGLRIVGERGWELEATGPSRIWNQQQLAGALGGGARNDADLVSAVRALHAQNERIESRLASIVLNTGGLLELTDQKSEGGNADRVELMNTDALATAIAERMKGSA